MRVCVCVPLVYVCMYIYSEPFVSFFAACFESSFSCRVLVRLLQGFFLTLPRGASAAAAHCSLAFRVVVAEIPFTLSIRSSGGWLTTFMRVYWEPGMTFIVLHDI